MHKPLSQVTSEIWGRFVGKLLSLTKGKGVSTDKLDGHDRFMFNGSILATAKGEDLRIDRNVCYIDYSRYGSIVRLHIWTYMAGSEDYAQHPENFKTTAQVREYARKHGLLVIAEVCIEEPIIRK